MSKILCLDASTEACSVALLNGEQITDDFRIAPREHAKLLLPMVKGLLADSGLALHQLDAIACNVGPGAFTGIRIAVSVAQGLAYGASLPAIALSSLGNLAFLGQSRGQSRDSRINHWLCAMDARMEEVYLGGYRVLMADSLEPLALERVIAPEQIDFSEWLAGVPPEQIGLIGSGWQVYQRSFLELLNQQGFNGLAEQLASLVNQSIDYPNARYGLLQAQKDFIAGKLLPPDLLQPTYLRNNVAEKKSD